MFHIDQTIDNQEIDFSDGMNLLSHTSFGGGGGSGNEGKEGDEGDEGNESP